MMKTYWPFLAAMLFTAVWYTKHTYAHKRTSSTLPGKQITIALAGDTMLGRLTNEAIGTRGYAWPWGNLLPALQSYDLNIVNLETTLTNSTQAVPKVFNFKASPDRVKSLQLANIGMVNLANNHMLDFGVQGLHETLATLDEAGIAHAGAGLGEKQAAEPAVVERKGIRIGMLGYTDNEPGWQAGKDRPGINYISLEDNQLPGTIVRVAADVKRLKQQVDIVIVSLHWGGNWPERPPHNHVQLAQAAIDAGASIVHGHSAHIIQGVQRYHDGLIIYSAGDFVDDYAIDAQKRNDLSFLFVVTLGKRGITHVKLVPTRIANMQVNYATGADRAWLVERMRELSP